MSILRVKTSIINEINTTANDVASCEGWPIGLAGAGRTERVTIIAVVPVGVFIPTWEQKQINGNGWQEIGNNFFLTLRSF